MEGLVVTAYSQCAVGGNNVSGCMVKILKAVLHMGIHTCDMLIGLLTHAMCPFLPLSAWQVGASTKRQTPFQAGIRRCTMKLAQSGCQQIQRHLGYVCEQHQLINVCCPTGPVQACVPGMMNFANVALCAFRHQNDQLEQPVTEPSLHCQPDTTPAPSPSTCLALLFSMPWYCSGIRDHRLA